MIKNRKQMFIVIVAFIMVLILGTTTYAFFNYTRTGVPNTIRVGRISFVSRQQQTITLTDLFPIDPEEQGIMEDSTKVGTLKIEIEGDTDYIDGVEYLISTTNASVYTSDGKTIPISINVTVEDLGDESSTYFTARNSKNANIYKRLSGDIISGNQMLLVGYIKPNTTSGEAEGVDGSITIKAYIDENMLAITDTPDENVEWQNGRTVISTEEWNAVKTTGISFQVKVEANEGIWVDEPFYEVMKRSAVMDNINSTYVNNATPGIDFSNISGDTNNDGVADNGRGIYILSSTATETYPIMYYRGNVDNNVYFGGFCWNIIRTTDTGGLKLIYNGENTGTDDEPICQNTGTDSQITLNISGADVNTFKFATNETLRSIGSARYMYGDVYNSVDDDYVSGAYFGHGFTYDDVNGVYSLTDTTIGIDEHHHYTCNLTTASGTCSEIRYYVEYYKSNGNSYLVYLLLSNGNSIEDILLRTFRNENSSYIKTIIDTWYEQKIYNMMFEEKIEDTIFCNDTTSNNIAGWNPDGPINKDLMFSPITRGQLYNPSLKCYQKKDSYTTSSNRGNGDLDYPVGLITSDEIILAGGKMATSNSDYYLKSGAAYWTISPRYYSVGAAYFFTVTANGNLGSKVINQNLGVRPVISLKEGTSVKDGTGTPTDPYIIK